MRRPIGANAERLGQRPGVALVCLHAARPRGVHRSIVRIGDDDLVSECLETLRDPFALRTGLEQNPRRRAIPEYRGESLATGHDPLLRDAAVRREGAQLALAFVEIDSYHIHGWPPRCVPRRQTMSTLL